MSITVTIQDEQGTNHRVTLPPEIYSGMDELSMGIWLKKLYYGPKSGRMFAEKHTQWIGCRTPYWVELDESEFLGLCAVAGIEPPEKIKAETIE